MGYQEDFIYMIIPYIDTWRKFFGFGVNSAICAQACLESAYSRSNKAKYNNFFGLKYKEGRVTCNSGSFTDTSSEQLPDGTYVTIKTKWFAFDSVNTGVEGYYQFISTGRYQAAMKATDPLSYLQALKSAGYATSQKYVDNCMAIVNKYNLTQFDQEVTMKPDSPLASGIINSPNTYGLRTVIDTITVHHMGCCPSPTAKDQCERFAKPSREASATYCIGNNGDIWQSLLEAYAPQTSSSKSNDMRAITIEVANSMGAPYWTISAEAMNSLILLLTDICRRNNIKQLIWSGNKQERINHYNGSNLTLHRDFSSTLCPGPFLTDCMPLIAIAVNDRLNAGPTSEFIINGYDYAPVFDPAYYYERYADLKAAFGYNVKALWQHFQQFGMQEMRRASDEFDPVYYKNTYKDLVDAYGNVNPMYYFHYVAFGKQEGRHGKG